MEPPGGPSCCWLQWRPVPASGAAERISRLNFDLQGKKTSGSKDSTQPTQVSHYAQARPSQPDPFTPDSTQQLPLSTANLNMSAPDEKAQPGPDAEPAKKRDEHAEGTQQASQAQEETTEPTKPEVKVSMCGVCNENPGKYKCPRCRTP